MRVAAGFSLVSAANTSHMDGGTCYDRMWRLYSPPLPAHSPSSAKAIRSIFNTVHARSVRIRGGIRISSFTQRCGLRVQEPPHKQPRPWLHFQTNRRLAITPNGARLSGSFLKTTRIEEKITTTSLDTNTYFDCLRKEKKLLRTRNRPDLSVSENIPWNLFIAFFSIRCGFCVWDSNFY